MTAPAAPELFGRFDGGKVRLRWRPVLNATDYKLYVARTSAPTTLEDDIADDEVGADGWFVAQFIPDEVPCYIRLTALNVGAEESAYSNQLKLLSWGPGHF